MAKFIKTIHDRVNFAIKKGLTGFIPPSKIDDEVHAESMNLWKKYVEEYQKTKRISAYLRPFETSENFSLNVNGDATLVNAWQFPIAARIQTGAALTIVDSAEYYNRINHPVKTPTAEYPVAFISGTTMHVVPVGSSVTGGRIYYLKKPTKPVYAFNVSGTRYVYDDATSTDIEWPEQLHDEIMNRVLMNLGINMRESILMQASQQEKIQEGK